MPRLSKGCPPARHSIAHRASTAGCTGFKIDTMTPSGRRYSMLRMSLAPCAPFTVDNELMIEAAAMARKHPGVRLHTHLAENQEDVDYSLKVYGCRPGEYLKCALQIDQICCHVMLTFSRLFPAEAPLSVVRFW